MASLTWVKPLPYNASMTHAFAGFWFYFSYPLPAAGAWVRAT